MTTNDMTNSPTPLSAITETILASYQEHPETTRVGQRFLPSQSKIVDILNEVRQLLFPGFFGRKQLTDENVSFHVGNLAARLCEELAEQINHCMCSDRTCEDCLDPAACRAEAWDKARAFLTEVPALREVLVLDAQAALDGDPAAKSVDEIVYCYPGFLAITIHRIAHALVTLGVPLMPRIMAEHAHSITGTDIHPGATIGKRFFIDHATGVVIGETCEIGDNVKVYQGVTLGARSFPKDERGHIIKGQKRHPTIADNVTIYPNATILGGETTIGSGVTVGGNAYVMESVESGHLVVQESPKLHLKKKKKS